MLVLSVVPVEATITTTYYETFTTDTVNANPTSSAAEGAWYTYSECNFSYSNVNASHHFLINDSKSTKAKCYANFTFATLPSATSAWDVSRYTYFYYQFRYNNTLSAKAKSNHSGVEFKLNGATYTVCTMYVYGLNESVAANKDRIVVTNYSGAVKINHTSKYGFTYGIVYQPDYDANTLTVILMNESSGATLNTTTMTLMGEDTIQSLHIQNYPASRTVYIWVDNMAITKSVPTYTSLPSMEITIAIFAIPVLLFVAIMALAVSGTITTPEAIVSLLIIILLAFVTLSILLS
jgi:hypothetical protein